MVNFPDPGDVSRPNEQEESPERDAPAFPDTLSESELIAAIKEYAAWCVRQFDVLEPIVIEPVKLEISFKMERAAGKVIAKNGGDDLRMRFAWKAYQKWGWNDDWTAVIRHELVHILQYQTKGSGDHGRGFERKARKADAPRHCPQFAEYEYELFCSGCGQFVAGRFKRSKVVKQPEKYSSNCCNESLKVEDGGQSRYSVAEDMLGRDRNE